MKFLLIIAISGLFSCQSQQEKRTKIGQKEVTTNDKLSIQHKSDSAKTANAVSNSFLDSITKKFELSIGQIRDHTLIDSIYYSGIFSDAGFTGDTVFDLHRGFKGAIIDYDDRRSCIYKFLLVLSADNKNVANKIIYTDCDHDESTDYTSLNYKLINDSSFETIETYIPAKSKMQKIEKLKWKISNMGRIDSLR